MATMLEKLLHDEEFPIVSALVAYLRSQSPRLVPTGELALAISQPKPKVYTLVKKARTWLRLTTKEGIPNSPKRKMRTQYGYTVTDDPRPNLYESMKAGNRADGHIAQERLIFEAIDRAKLKDPADVALFMTQQARIRLGEARLKTSEDARAALAQFGGNKHLTAKAAEDSRLPWEEVGSTDPNKVDVPDRSDDER